MADEMFDLVNERDEVIGACLRSEVHRRGLRHRSAHVLVFNDRGQVFLQKRSLAKDNHPGVWDSSASGHVDHGEDYDTCALRELFEELGWRPRQVPERLFKLEACAGTGEEFVWAYRCSGDGPFRLNPDEIDAGAWFTPAEVGRWIYERPGELAPAFVLVWRELLARKLAPSD